MPHVLLACSITGIWLCSGRGQFISTGFCENWRLETMPAILFWSISKMTALIHFTEEPNSCQMAVSRAVPVLQFSCAGLDVLTGAYLHRPCPHLPRVLGHTSHAFPWRIFDEERYRLLTIRPPLVNLPHLKHQSLRKCM